MDKLRILRANTVHAGVTVNSSTAPGSSNAFFKLKRAERCRLFDYIEELRQQATWDEEKCHNQR